MVELRKEAKYGLVVPTSMGVRLTPCDRKPVHCATEFSLSVTSAETNVASISAALGEKVKVLTKFVKGSPIAEIIKSNLRSRNMEYEGAEVVQDGPWGVRHQFNIADSGFGVRGPIVYNDRAGEVGRLLSEEDFDFTQLFEKDGVKILHLSGLIAALSESTGKLCVALARKAKENGTIVSFDLNYRATFWKNREKELTKIFSEIACLSDVLIGNEEDFQLCLHVKGPEAGGKDLTSKIHSFQAMIQQLGKLYPNTSVFATTLRQVLSANRHLWGAILCYEGEWSILEPREIEVFDRIGGGDGYVGGLLYAILQGWEKDKCNGFGWASGALAAGMLTDYALPQSEEQIFSIMKGDARVKR